MLPTPTQKTFISSEMTDMKQSEVVYKANAKAVQVQDKAMGSLLDTVA